MRELVKIQKYVNILEIKKIRKSLILILYRKSHLVKKNNYHPFDTPDDFNNYIDYYEIYDINTGEILKKENLFNKTGTIWDYDSKSGKLYIESHLVNGKIVFQREYKEDGTVAREYNYKK